LKKIKVCSKNVVMSRWKAVKNLHFYV